MNSTKITLTRDGNFISFSTFSRKLGKHGRFLVDFEKMRNWYESEAAEYHSFLDVDLSNVLQCSFWKNRVCFKVKWLSVSGTGNISGVEERFEIPADEIFEMLTHDGYKKTILYNPDIPAGTVQFTEAAQAIIGHMNTMQLTAFKRAMRLGALQWPETHTTVYADGKRDFFFRTNDGMCGGLIYSDYAGKPKYSVHT